MKERDEGWGEGGWGMGDGRKGWGGGRGTGSCKI